MHDAAGEEHALRGEPGGDHRQQRVPRGEWLFSGSALTSGVFSAMRTYITLLRTEREKQAIETTESDTLTPLRRPEIQPASPAAPWGRVGHKDLEAEHVRGGPGEGPRADLRETAPERMWSGPPDGKKKSCGRKATRRGHSQRKTDVRSVMPRTSCVDC